MRLELCFPLVPFLIVRLVIPSDSYLLEINNGIYEMTHPIASAMSDIVKTVIVQHVVGVWRKREKDVTVDFKAFFVTPVLEFT